MKIQKQPDYLIFADSAKKGENAEFPDISRGWGVTIEQTASKPPMEWMNGAFNRIDKNMLYLLQQGVPEWNEKVTYPVNAIIKYNGVLYTAIVENDNAKPSTNTTKWKKTQAEIPTASTTQNGIVKLNSAIDSDSQTEAATSLAVKKVNDSAVKKSGDMMTGDLTINGKLALKTGDYGVGGQTGTATQNLDEHLNSGFYGTNTAKIPNLPFTGGGSASSLLVLPTESPHWKCEQLSVADGRIPRIYYRTDTRNDGKQAWYEAITTANVDEYTHPFKGDLANKSLNDLTGTDAGNYFQGKNILATSENGYPINQAGTLTVMKNGADGEGCCQIYTTYRNARQFIRNYRGGTQSWEPWVEVITTANEKLSNVIDKFTSGGIESRVYSNDKRFYFLVRDDGVAGVYDTVKNKLLWSFRDDYFEIGKIPLNRIDGLNNYILSMYNQSFNTNGFTKLPNGLVIQWGIANYKAKFGTSGMIQTFYTQFPNSCFLIICNDGGEGVHITSASPISNTQFKCWGRRPLDSAPYADTTLFYMAIGF